MITYLVDCRQTDLLCPYPIGALIWSHTLIVAPATLHKRWSRETLTTGLEMSTAQTIQWDLCDLWRKVTQRVSRFLVCLSKCEYTKVTYKYQLMASTREHLCANHITMVTWLKLKNQISCFPLLLVSMWQKLTWPPRNFTSTVMQRERLHRVGTLSLSR